MNIWNHDLDLLKVVSIESEDSIFGFCHTNNN